MPIAKFLHTADVHLGRPFGFLPPLLAEERRRDQRRTFTKICDLALERDVDLFLIAGDLFDSHDPDSTDIEAVTRELTRLSSAGKRVFLLPGNHDYVSASSFWHHVTMEGVHVFTDTDWNAVELKDLGLVIHGIAFNRAKSDKRPFEDLALAADAANIVMAHASYELYDGQLEKYHPFSASELASTQASYVALGHYHRYNTLPAGRTVACYPGTPEGISFDGVETEDRHVAVGHIDDDGSAYIEPVRVNLRIMRRTEIDCTSFDSQMSLLDTIRKFCDPNILIQLKLTGIPLSDLDVSLDDLPERFRESCAYMTVDSSDLSVSPDLDADSKTIRGRFCKHFLTQISETSDPERQRLLRRALELGLAAFAEK